MNIKHIISEEIQSLVERQQGIYTIPELAQNLKAYGLSPETIEIYEDLLLKAYQEGGDEKVEEIYKEMTGVDIEYISKGRYMYNRLVNPDKYQQVRQDAKYVASDAEYGIAPKKYAKE